MTATADIVRSIINRTCRERGTIAGDHLVNDLGLDSLDVLELFMAIEARFDIEFSESEMVRSSTVGALIALVAGKARAAA